MKHEASMSPRGIGKAKGVKAITIGLSWRC